MNNKTPLIGRRRILAGLGTGIAALGAVTTARQAAAAKGGRWQPALEAADDWMELPGRHRLVLDSISPAGAGEALFFTQNYIDMNKSAYHLVPSQLANVVILRHFATIFGYSDAVWAKYGPAFAEMTHFMNPKTKQAAKRNLYDVENFGEQLTNRGATLSGLADQGVQFAVCGLATEKIAEMLAPQMNAKVDDVHADFAGNLIRNARLVSAGIVAVNRAQERGYALAYTG
jgi:intracellular sulfur oxidation DsrE/DsrF family protein